MTGASSEDIDRLSIRTRPNGWPVMRQFWGKLLFIHWPIAAELLRPLIPERLTIDTFEGRAWVGLVPFTMWGVRPSFTPPIPGLSAFHELNVRTYVHFDGAPGVWFCSLDANNRTAVWAARKFFNLPYFNARMSLKQQNRTITYDSTRTHASAPPARFAATWNFGNPLPASRPGSLDFFLTERYCLYAAHRAKIYRCRIFHQPWPLHKADLLSYDSTMVESHGLPAPPGAPVLHYAESLKVDIWPLVQV